MKEVPGIPEFHEDINRFVRKIVQLSIQYPVCTEVEWHLELFSTLFHKLLVVHWSKNIQKEIRNTTSVAAISQVTTTFSEENFLQESSTSIFFNVFD